MFRNCNKLNNFNFKIEPETTGVPRFFFDNATDINHMFEGCYEMSTFSGNISGSSVIDDARYAFADCKSLESADLSCFLISSYLLPSFNFPFSKMFILHDEADNVIQNNVLNEFVPFRLDDYSIATVPIT